MMCSVTATWSTVSMLLLATVAVTSAAVTSSAATPRSFPIFDGEGSPRLGICYGPFRDGQQPGDAANQPTAVQIREDLHLIQPHWKMLRVYGSDPFADLVCRIIRDDKLDIQVVVGAWITSEQKSENGQTVPIPAAVAANNKQVNDAIAIANAYPSVVAAVSVGNEAMVAWSFHAVRPERVIEYVRRVRQETNVAVTVADDFMFWTSPASRPVAAELDFIITHVYAMWHAQPLENALSFTQEKYRQVTENHPDRTIVIGETGWATDKETSGDAANRLQGQAGESQQADFYEQLTDWTRREKIPLFYFEAFDENWKGGDDPHEAEKHWGVFFADRSPKRITRLLNEKRSQEKPE